MKSSWLLWGLLANLVLTATPQAAMLAKRSVLDNGMVLLTSEQSALPMVSVELLIAAGARHDPPGQEGLANLTARLLTYGTTRRTALEISESLDFLGATLSANGGEDLTSVSMSVLKKDLDAGFDLLAEVLTSATFPEAEVERQKQSVIAAIKARDENPGEIALKKFQRILYPMDRLGLPVEGTEDSVRRIRHESVREFFDRHYRPNRTIVAIVGDISHEEAERLLNRVLGGWKKGEPSGKPRAPRVHTAAETVRVERDLTQSNIILGHEGLARENPDYYAVQVMNYILGGGGFSSRAMESIRNERGLAYSVYSYFSSEKGRGVFHFVMQTKNETAEEAIRIAREEIARIREQPISEQELEDAKRYLTGSFPLRLDTNRKVANFLAHVEYFGLGLDYPQRYLELIKNVTREDVLRVARSYLHPDRLITVVVGKPKPTGP